MIEGIETGMIETTARRPTNWCEDAARWLELAAGFVGLPLLVGTLVVPVGWIPSLWLVAAMAAWRMQRDTRVRPQGFWAHVDWRRAAPELRRVVARFAASMVILVIAVRVWAPERWCDLPRNRAGLWMTVMVLYPVLSVYAQEVLYRRYLFHRLRGLRISETWIVRVSAVAFAAMHMIFRNEIAVVLTLIGGWFFADTYRRTGSLRLVCLEHALYGNLVFTIGLGQFFFHGFVKR